MNTDKEQLLAKLQQVKWGLANREIIEQTASFIFQDGKISTFNDEIFCQVDYDSPIQGAVHADPLIALLEKMSEKDIKIEVNEGELLIKGKNNRAGIRMDNEVTLELGKIEQPDEWNNLGDQFTDAIEIVQQCASKEDSSFNLTCLHITPTHIEACDNFQMMRYPFKTGITSPCLVRKEAIKQITGLGMTEVAEGSSWLHFRSPGGLQLSCRKWEEEYSDLSDIIEFTGIALTLPGGLAEAVEKAEIFSSENTENTQVRVEIKNNGLRIKGMGAKGWYEERRKINYSGEEISFLITPKLLVDITKRTSECEVDQTRLKIDAEKFVYVACLGTAE